MKYSLQIFAVLFITLVSCRHDSDLSSFRDITYTSDIQPIVAGNCTQSGCHNSLGDAGFSLTTYDDVIQSGVKAGDAHSSRFYKVISNHGGPAMPPDPLPRLTSDQIKIIYVWIEQGAKNN